MDKIRKWRHYKNDFYLGPPLLKEIFPRKHWKWKMKMQICFRAFLISSAEPKYKEEIYLEPSTQDIVFMFSVVNVLPNNFINYFLVTLILMSGIINYD